MTAGARDRAMRSHKGEFSRIVIEGREVFPGCDRMARFASHRLAGTQAQHALSELPVVRIAMTHGAGTIVESILSRILEMH